MKANTWPKLVAILDPNPHGPGNRLHLTSGVTTLDISDLVKSMDLHVVPGQPTTATLVVYVDEIKMSTP